MDKLYSETVKNILERRTVRSFTDEELTDSETDALLECAMWAPSARNKQPCHVRVLTGKDRLDELNTDFKNLVGRDTPAYTRYDVNPVYQTAPALFLIYAEGDSALDGGIMVENIAIAAEGMGLGSCIIGSIGALLNNEAGKKWKKLAGIPEDWKFIISIAVGHKNETPDKKPRTAENFRKI